LKVVQIVPTIQYGDAIGNAALALRDILINMGHDTAIYADGITLREEQRRLVFSIVDLPMLNEDDVLLFHISNSTFLHDELPKINCRKIGIYHNVTPAKYFREYSYILFRLCAKGKREVKQLRDVFDYCLTDSDFNRQDLISYGYKCPIDVCPILIPFEDYELAPNKEVVEKYKNGRTNILFLGRIAPSKKHEDVIAAFSSYKKYYDPDARLLLVGTDQHVEGYRKRLEVYIKHLGVEDVIFTGKVMFDEMLAYYRIANVFLCMSEHEGFCVPLVESMYFDVPIIAYAGAAVPETLGGSGVLLSDKDPLITAGVIKKVVSDAKLKKEILDGQRRRLKDFSYENVSGQFKKYLEDFIEGNR